MMRKLEIFDPPMCCSTGVCGPNVDPTLVSFAADLHWLVNRGVAVERYNLAQTPQAFVHNVIVNASLRERGNGCLPLVLLDGAVVSEGRYPSREELARLAGVQVEESDFQATGKKLPVIKSGCC